MATKNVGAATIAMNLRVSCLPAFCLADLRKEEVIKVE